MKFHAGKRSFSFRDDEQTFPIFQRKRKRSFKRIKPPLCFLDLTVSCTIEFLFEKLLWQRLNDKQPAPLQETSNFGDARTNKTWNYNCFSLIETTTEYGEISIFPGNSLLKITQLTQSILLKTVLARMKNRTICQGFPAWWCQHLNAEPRRQFWVNHRKSRYKENSRNI